MSEATTEGRFCIDLPDSDAATATATATAAATATATATATAAATSRQLARWLDGGAPEDETLQELMENDALHELVLKVASHQRNVITRFQAAMRGHQASRRVKAKRQQMQA